MSKESISVWTGQVIILATNSEVHRRTSEGSELLLLTFQSIKASSSFILYSEHCSIIFLCSKVRGQINPSRGLRPLPCLGLDFRATATAHTHPHEHLVFISSFLLCRSSRRRHIPHGGVAARNKVRQENLTGIFLFVPDLRVNSQSVRDAALRSVATPPRLSSHNKRLFQAESLPRPPNCFAFFVCSCVFKLTDGQQRRGKRKSLKANFEKSEMTTRKNKVDGRKTKTHQS